LNPKRFALKPHLRSSPVPEIRRAVLAGALLALAAVPARAGDAATGAKPGPMAELLQPMVGVNLAGAVVAVATGDRVLDLEAVGYADLEAGKPMAPDTEFWIASESKAMTAAALMMLVDEGKVSVDAPVETYLPEFRDMRVKVAGQDGAARLVPADHPILVREILSHTSGLAFSSPEEKPTLDLGALAKRVRSYARMPLNAQPGTKYAYSNAGINTAGRIIEVVSGLAYEKFMEDRLFGPLGMTDTTFRPNLDQIARLAVTYKPSADKTKLERTEIDQLKYPLDAPDREPMPAGGLFSTAGDEVRFCRMLLNNGMAGGVRYLSEGAVRQMTTRQSGPNTGVAYGFGWKTSDGAYSHSGADGTNVQVEPGSGVISVYMVQRAGTYPNNPKDIPELVNEAARRLVLRAR
jgi:CubicO group peptidase (beta-lactamase class C family)